MANLLYFKTKGGDKMLNFIYVMRFLGGLGAFVPMVMAIPLPQVQVIGGIVAAVSEAATIWLERNK